MELRPKTGDATRTAVQPGVEKPGGGGPVVIVAKHYIGSIVYYLVQQPNCMRLERG